MIPLPSTPMLLIIAVAIGFGGGWKVKDWQEDAGRLRDELVMQKAEEGSAKAIAAIKVQNVTIRQPLEREIRENTVYADCRNSPDGMRLLNATLIGPGAGKLPTIDATDGR